MTTGTDLAGGRRWPARHRKQLAVLAVGAVVLAGGVLAFMPRPQPGPSHTVAADCGLVHCSAALPAMASSNPAPGRAGQPGTGKHRAAARPPSAAAHRSPAAALAPTRAPAPVPSAVAATAPPAPPLTVSYTVIQSQPGYGNTEFVGRFTLVNRTGTAIAGWVLKAGLPDGWVRWVSTSPGGHPRYPAWFPVHGGFAINGPRRNEAIPAHGSMVLYFSAQGPGTSLSGCTINGSPC